MAKLELGCGVSPRPGYIHHDRIAHSADVDVAHDLEVFPWPWADGQFEQILALDLFEHLRCDIATWMDECWRILAPGGRVILRVPHWRSQDMWIDPTHRRWFDERTFDYWDPDKYLHKHGRIYFAESGKWWKVSATVTNGNIDAVLEKRA
jgi:predicted SAM-dependent methyltransferase